MIQRAPNEKPGIGKLGQRSFQIRRKFILVPQRIMVSNEPLKQLFHLQNATLRKKKHIIHSFEVCSCARRCLTVRLSTLTVTSSKQLLSNCPKNVIINQNFTYKYEQWLSPVILCSELLTLLYLERLNQWDLLISFIQSKFYNTKVLFNATYKLL